MNNIRLLILGATGGTGQQLVSQALQDGNEVTAFVRNAQRLTTSDEHLHVVTGSGMDDERSLAESVRGQDAVISALGVGHSLKSGGLIARSIPTIIAAMESEGVRRLIFISAYGVGATRSSVPLLPRLLMRTLLRDLYADKATGEAHLRRSQLDWTLVYPATLTNGPRTGQYRIGEQLALRGIPTVSRADVAHCVLNLVADRTYLRRGVLISQ
jgi:putative NADH-flavin reductase